MSHFDEETWLHLYPISLIYSGGKFYRAMEDLGAWLTLQDVRSSKTLGWICDCGAKSRKPRSNGRFKHSLYKRAMWHILARNSNGSARCSNIREYEQGEFDRRLSLKEGEL